MTGMVILSMLALTSCVKDDTDDCGLNIRFRYIYNVKNADAFQHEVKSIQLFVFDENGKFIRSYQDDAKQFEASYSMRIRDLKAGKYTLVCMARSEQDVDEDNQEFQIARLAKGDDIEKLTAHLDADEGINDHQFAHLYIGKSTLQYSGNPQDATIHLMKCSNSYRIILLPTHAYANLDANHYDIKIENGNRWLDHKGDLLPTPVATGEENVTHKPYHIEIATNGGNSTEQNINGSNSREQNINGSEILKEEKKDIALIYDLSSARLFRDDNTHLVITDKRSGKTVFDHSLPWLLSLYGGAQRHPKWEDQEYLDRQDHYTLTFYVDEGQDYHLQAKLKVNGWVLNLIDQNIK